MNADQILEAARAAIIQRAEIRDKPAERSMTTAVAVFNQLTGYELSELDGWIFMICLKLARSKGGAFHMDDYIDMAGYAALAGECGSAGA